MMKLLSFLKYKLGQFFHSYLDQYRHYYYGQNNDIRHFNTQLFKIKNRRVFINEDYKKNFSEIAYKVAERFESYKGNRDVDIKDYFEFGVYNGDATINFWVGLNAFYKTIPAYWDIHLFDSFQGMPETDVDSDKSERIGPRDLVSKGEQHVTSRLLNVGIPQRKIDIVKGFYEESLTPELQRNYMAAGIKAHFVNIDCDFYSSTFTVLKWLEPLMEQGSIVYFDDIDLYYKNPNMGELKAIEDFNEMDKNRGLAVDNWIDPAARCYIFWRNEA